MWPRGRRLIVNKTGSKGTLRNTSSDRKGLWFEVFELEVSLGFSAVRVSYCSFIWLKIEEKCMISEINKGNPPGWVYTRIASLTLQPASLCMRMSERSFSICATYLALKRVVICKSPLPWAGGVKLGRGDREEVGRDRKTETDSDSMWMTGVSVKEREQSECESGLHYITGSTQQRWTALENIHDCTSCVTQDPTEYDKCSNILYIFSSSLISAKDLCCENDKSKQLTWVLS